VAKVGNEAPPCHSRDSGDRGYPDFDRALEVACYDQPVLDPTMEGQALEMAAASEDGRRIRLSLDGHGHDHEGHRYGHRPCGHSDRSFSWDSLPTGHGEGHEFGLADRFGYCETEAANLVFPLRCPFVLVVEGEIEYHWGGVCGVLSVLAC
jgi:hypothetical protein